MQQGCILRDHADGGAQAFLRDVGDVLAVDADAAGAHVIKAQQQVGDGGFARTGAADEADLFAGLDDKVEACDDFAALLQRACHS